MLLDFVWNIFLFHFMVFQKRGIKKKKIVVLLHVHKLIAK